MHTPVLEKTLMPFQILTVGTDCRPAQSLLHTEEKQILINIPFEIHLLLLFLAFFADTVESQTMIQYFEIVIFLYYLFSFSQQILFDFFDRTALHTYKLMVEMVGALFPEVIAAPPVAEVHVIENSKITQPFPCPLDGSQSDFGIFIPYSHKDIRGTSMILFVLKQSPGCHFPLGSKFISRLLECIFDSLNPVFQVF